MKEFVCWHQTEADDPMNISGLRNNESISAMHTRANTRLCT